MNSSEALAYLVKSASNRGKRDINKISESFKILKKLVDKDTPVKATFKDEVRPIFDPETLAAIDAYYVTDFYCPTCGNWLTNDSGLGEDEELNVICNNCGQVIKGIEIEDEE